MYFNLEQRGKQNRIEGTPGKERAFRKHNVMLGGDQRDPPPDDPSFFVKLGIWDAGEMGREVLLSHL
jgi:hypothetical protein